METVPLLSSGGNKTEPQRGQVTLHKGTQMEHFLLIALEMLPTVEEVGRLHI